MNWTLIGLDHTIQWRDATGDLRATLEQIIADHRPDLIAEETSARLPTTVGQRIALRKDIPWLNVDLSLADRKKLKINRPVPTTPLFDDTYEYVGSAETYESDIQAVREKHWIERVCACRCRSVIFLCGAIHLDPVRKRLEEIGHNIQPVRLWEADWYKAHVGELLIFEQGENRYAEFRRSGGS